MTNQKENIKTRFRQLQDSLLNDKQQTTIAKNLQETALFLQQLDSKQETNTHPHEVYQQLTNTVKIIFNYLERTSKENTNQIETHLRRLLLGVSQFCSAYYRVYHPLGCGVMIRQFLSSECRLFIHDKIQTIPFSKQQTFLEVPSSDKPIPQQQSSQKQWSITCTYKTQFFTDCIQIIMNNLEHFQEKFNETKLEVIGQYLRLIYYMDDYLIKNKLIKLIKNNIDALQLLFNNPTKEIMTNVSKQSLDEVIEYTTKLLRSVHDDETKRKVQLLGAQLSLSMITLPSIEKKLVGCKILSKYSYQILYHTNAYVSQTYYAEWVLKHRFFQMVFEDHCQSSLIKASEDTFKLLVKRGQIDNEKFRKFFCILEKADSELRKSMFRLIQPYRVDYYQIESMLQIFKTVRGVQFYDDQFFYFLQGLSRHSTQTQLKNTLAVVKAIISEHYPRFESYMVRKRAVECYAYVFQRLLTYKQPEDRLNAYTNAVSQFLSEPTENRLIMIKTLFESMTESKMDLFYQQRLSVTIVDELKFIQKSLGLFNGLHRNKGDLTTFIRLSLKHYKKQSDLSSLSRQNLLQGVNFPQIFQEMLELIRNQQLQELFRELVQLITKKQFPFCCIKWVFLRLNRKLLRPIKKEYTDMVATQATIDNPASFIGLNALKQLIFNSQSEAVRRGACELLTEIYTNFSDDFREEGEIYLVQFMKQTLQTIDKQFQLFFNQLASSNSIKGTLELIEQLMLDTEYFGVLNLKAHNSQVPTSTVLLKIYNNITYGQDVLKIFQKKFPSNKTLFEVIVQVAKQFKIGPLDMGLEYPSNLAIKNHGLTLEQLKLNNQQLNAFKLPQSRFKKEPLLIDGQVSTKAKKVFTDMFNRFAPSGKMGKKQCGSYIQAVTIGYCPIYDSRISSLFAEYDTDKDEVITLQDFLRFYKDSLLDPEKAEAVQKNLSNLRYRRDLKPFDQDLDFLNPQLLFRHYVWNNKQIYEYLFELSHQEDHHLTQLAQKLLLRLPTYSKISESLNTQIDLQNKSSFEVEYLLAALQNQLRNNRQKSQQFIQVNNHQVIYQHLYILSTKQQRTENDQNCLVICLHLLRSLLAIDNLKTISLQQFPHLACTFRNTDVFINIIREGVKHGDSNLLEPALALQLTQNCLPLEWIEQAGFSKDKDTRIITCNFLYLWLLKTKTNQINLFDIQIRPYNNQQWFHLLTSITKIDSYSLDFHDIFLAKINTLQKCEQSLQKNRFNPIINGNLSIIKQIYHKLTNQHKTLLNKTLTQLLPKLISNQNRSLVYELRIIDYSQQLLTDLQIISATKITKQILPRNNYVGIKNLGSICYMNSILQQFFMIKQFYNLVMSLQSPTELTEVKDIQLIDNFLAQLQQMYIHLECSQKQYYDPTKFCLAVKDYQNNPINVHVQQDAHQFLNSIFGKIQDQVKKQQKLTDLQLIFGGKTVTQITCLTCQNKNQVIEHFYHLSVQVNGMKTLKDSFNKLIHPEQINDYFCSNCNHKVDKISKQMLIKQAPEILIINLQRIIFDLETFLKVKVHTRFQFEHNLDLHNYFSSSNKPAPYNLKGVVIHAGTSEGGHYYSLIKMQGKWYKFNDQTVTLFNESDIGREAFGGDENTDQWGELTSSTNAYILFYQKTKETQQQVHQQQLREFSHPLVEKVLQSNRQFANELKFNQPSFFTTLHNLYLKQMNNFRDQNNSNLSRLWKIYFCVLQHLAVTSSLKQEVINQIRDDIFILIQKMPRNRQQLLQQMNDKFQIVKHNLCLHNDSTYKDIYQKILTKALDYVLKDIYKEWKQTKDQSPGLLSYTHQTELQLIHKLLQLFSDPDFMSNILKSSQFFELWKSLISSFPDMIIELFLSNDINRIFEILMGNECTIPGSTKKRLDLPHCQAVSVVQITILMVQYRISQLKTNNHIEINSGKQLPFQLTIDDNRFILNQNFYNKLIREKLDKGLITAIIKFKSFNNRHYTQFIIQVLLKALAASDQLYDKTIIFNNIKNLLQIEDNLSNERLQWVIGIPQLQNTKIDGHQFGMMTSLQSQVHSYTSPLFFKEQNCKPFLAILFQKRKYFNAFSIYGIITLLSLLNQIQTVFEYILRLPPPCYTHKTYTDWIQSYTLRLKHEEHYSLPQDKDILYEQINTLLTSYKQKVRKSPLYDQLPVDKVVIGKNYQLTRRDTLSNELADVQMWTHLTYVLKNRPYGIGNFELPDDQFSFGSTKTNTSKYFLKSFEEDLQHSEEIKKQLTMVTFTIRTYKSITINFKLTSFKYKIYFNTPKHYSINCPYTPGSINDLIQINQSDLKTHLKDSSEEKDSAPTIENSQASTTQQNLGQSLISINQQDQINNNLGPVYDYGNIPIYYPGSAFDPDDRIQGKSKIQSPLNYQLQINCKVCTYLNSVMNLTCDMCGIDLR